MLTEQRKLFVDEHLKLRCKNATRAAINAGYSSKSAQSQASQILKDPKAEQTRTAQSETGALCSDRKRKRGCNSLFS